MELEGYSQAVDKFLNSFRLANNPDNECNRRESLRKVSTIVRRLREDNRSIVSLSTLQELIFWTMERQACD